MARRTIPPSTVASLVRRTSHLCFDGERMFTVAQSKRDHGQRGYVAPIDNRVENRKALSDPDAHAPRVHQDRAIARSQHHTREGGLRSRSEALLEEAMTAQSKYVCMFVHLRTKMDKYGMCTFADNAICGVRFHPYIHSLGTRKMTKGQASGVLTAAVSTPVHRRAAIC
jgi:hypothetical protein